MPNEGSPLYTAMLGMKDVRVIRVMKAYEMD